MKTIVVCDSGLGGLDVAAHFFNGQAEGAPEWKVVYVNAYPDAAWGYNDLPMERAQEELFKRVLEQMEGFRPEQCMIACNTLSIIWQRLAQWWRPSFPVAGIIDIAVRKMAGYMRRCPESDLLILGTKSTIASNVYGEALLAEGIAAERIRSLACPRLATLIEQAPLAPAVRERIAGYAQQARTLFPQPPKRLALGFCCTHFGYATAYWQEAFGAVFGEVDCLNPNEDMQCPGTGKAFEYHSKLTLGDSQRVVMTRWFMDKAPAIAEGLNDARTFVF